MDLGTIRSGLEKLIEPIQQDDSNNPGCRIHSIRPLSTPSCCPKQPLFQLLLYIHFGGYIAKFNPNTEEFTLRKASFDQLRQQRLS